MLDWLLSNDAQDQFLAFVYSAMFIWLSYRILRYTRGYILILCLSMLTLLARGLFVYIPRLFGWDWLADAIQGNLSRLISYTVTLGFLSYATWRRWKANHGDAKAKADIEREKDDFENKENVK